MDLDALYRAHVGALYAFVYSCVGTREAAEEITSEVFLAARDHLDPSSAEPSSVAWLYGVARRAVDEYWRAGRAARVIAFDVVRSADGAAPGSDPQRPEQAAAQAIALLARLPETYRAVLSYRLLEGLSVAETAGRLGISESYVKVLQHRALKRAAKLRAEAPAEARRRSLGA